MMKVEILRVGSTQTMRYVENGLGKLIVDWLCRVVDKVRCGLN